MGEEQLDECLKGCDVVTIPAGVPRKPGEHTLIYLSLTLLHTQCATIHILLCAIHGAIDSV